MSAPFTSALRIRELRSAAEAVAALAIACCLIACAVHPLLQDPSCDERGAVDSRLASLVIRIFADGGSSLEVRDRLRAEALEGAPAGRWETSSEKAAVALASCGNGVRRGAMEHASADAGATGGPALAMAW